VHNMISEWYFPEDSTADRVPEILRTRRNMRVDGRAEGLVVGPDGQAPPYLLMVSTIEPRKNHLGLLSAWERLRTQARFAGLRLVLVGMLGWESKKILRKFRPWLDRGELLLLEDVPADELRQLYRHARLTVCPSLYEGFDFSGIEAMRSGGVVAASDIAVHREVYLDAAALFSPYSPEDMASVIARLLDGEGERRELRDRGREVSARYLPGAILPQWEGLLQQLGRTP
jgi:glycosyltransferase involved in cell wall biosynthesis